MSIDWKLKNQRRRFMRITIGFYEVSENGFEYFVQGATTETELPRPIKGVAKNEE